MTTLQHTISSLPLPVSMTQVTRPRAFAPNLPSVSSSDFLAAIAVLQDPASTEVARDAAMSAALAQIRPWTFGRVLRRLPQWMRGQPDFQNEAFHVAQIALTRALTRLDLERLRLAADPIVAAMSYLQHAVDFAAGHYVLAERMPDLPQDAVRKASRVRRAQRRLASEGRPADADAVHAVLRQTSKISRDTTAALLSFECVNLSPDSETFAQIPAPDDDDESADAQERALQALALIDDPSDRRLVAQSFGIQLERPLTISEIAREDGRSRSRIHQRVLTALARAVARARAQEPSNPGVLKEARRILSANLEMVPGRGLRRAAVAAATAALVLLPVASQRASAQGLAVLTEADRLLPSPTPLAGPTIWVGGTMGRGHTQQVAFLGEWADPSAYGMRVGILHLQHGTTIGRAIFEQLGQWHGVKVGARGLVAFPLDAVADDAHDAQPTGAVSIPVGITFGKGVWELSSAFTLGLRKSVYAQVPYGRTTPKTAIAPFVRTGVGLTVRPAHTVSLGFEGSLDAVTWASGGGGRLSGAVPWVSTAARATVDLPRWSGAPTVTLMVRREEPLEFAMPIRHTLALGFSLSNLTSPNGVR